jgi:hypothetical protein
MPFEDVSAPDADHDTTASIADTSHVPRTAWERKIDDARAKRHEKLGARARNGPEFLNDEAPPPPGESPIDRAIATLEARPDDEVRPVAAVLAMIGPRTRAALTFGFAFVLGVSVGLVVIARLPGTESATSAPVVAEASGEGLSFAAPKVLSAALAPITPTLATSDAEATTAAAVTGVITPDFVARHLATPPEAVTLATLELPTAGAAAPELPGFPSLASPKFDVPPPSLMAFLDGPRIFVTAPNTVTQQAVAALPEKLAVVAPQDTKIARVSYSVSRTHVRYYHADDAANALRVAETMGGEARDFTGFSPKPRVGTLELYLAGSSGAEAAEPARRTSKRTIGGFGSAIRFLTRTN